MVQWQGKKAKIWGEKKYAGNTSMVFFLNKTRFLGEKVLNNMIFFMFLKSI